LFNEMFWIDDALSLEQSFGGFSVGRDEGLLTNHLDVIGEPLAFDPLGFEDGHPGENVDRRVVLPNL